MDSIDQSTPQRADIIDFCSAEAKGAT